jgi:hypothetical protein
MQEQQEQNRLQVQALQEQLQRALGNQGQGGNGHGGQQQQQLDAVAQPAVLPPININQGAQGDNTDDRVAELESQLAELRAARPHNQPPTFSGPGLQQLPFNAAVPGQWQGLAPSAFGNAYNAPQGFPQMPMTWNGALPTGGEYEIARHYTALAAGELEKMMLGNFCPSKIYQAIPSDSVLYPVVETMEKGGRLEYDPSSGQLTMADQGSAHIRETNLKRLIKTLDHPIKFALAWTWFVILANYKYQDPDLAAAMMRFGWKVVSYANSNDWSIVLRVYVEIATRILVGNLARDKAEFDSASFSEALGPYRTSATVPPISAFNNTVVGSSTTATSSAAILSTAARTAFRAERQVCKRFNRNECDGVSCKYQHSCLSCGQAHPSIFCVNSMRATAYPAQPATYGAPVAYNALSAMMGQQQFQPQQQATQGSQGFNAYQGYGQGQTANQHFGYSQPSAYPQQGQQGQAQSAPQPANKQRGFGNGYQGRGGQA